MATCERVEIPQPKYMYKLELTEDELHAALAVLGRCPCGGPTHTVYRAMEAACGCNFNERKYKATVRNRTISVEPRNG